MGKTLIVNPRYSDAGTLTASSAVGDAAAANLQKPRPNLVWQSTTVDPYLELQLATARLFDALVLGYFNARSGDTFRLRGATSKAGLTDGSAVYDSTALAYWPAGSDLSNYKRPHRWLYFTPAQACAWWRVDFNFSGNSDGYVRGGRLMLGIAHATAGVGAGWSSSVIEPPVQVEDISGEEAPRPRRARRVIEVEWPPGALTQAEGAALQELLLERGSAKDMALVLDSAATAYPMEMCYIGRAKEGTALQHYSPSRRHLSLKLTELAPTEMR